ncbi:MAG: hypothetical protein MRY74_13970 [Neomegalonema sp.]|nr:hypothetical protein [Neomegalonema sp.]
MFSSIARAMRRCLIAAICAPLLLSGCYLSGSALWSAAEGRADAPTLVGHYSQDRGARRYQITQIGRGLYRVRSMFDPDTPVASLFSAAAALKASALAGRDCGKIADETLQTVCASPPAKACAVFGGSFGAKASCAAIVGAARALRPLAGLSPEDKSAAMTIKAFRDHAPAQDDFDIVTVPLDTPEDGEARWVAAQVASIRAVGALTALVRIDGPIKERDAVLLEIRPDQVIAHGTSGCWRGARKPPALAPAALMAELKGCPARLKWSRDNLQRFERVK